MMIGVGRLLRIVGSVLCAVGVFGVVGNTASDLVGDFTTGYTVPVVTVIVGVAVLAIGDVVIRKRRTPLR